MSSVLNSVPNKVASAGLFSPVHGAAVVLAALMLATAVPYVLAQQPLAAAAREPAAISPQSRLDKPLWRELTPAQQLALRPLSSEWDRMEGIRKQKWLEIANRYSSMNPGEQQRVHERMREWVRMTPAERRLVRENYTRSKKIDPGQKSEQWEKYQQLPEEKKKELAAAAKKREKGASLPKAAPGKAPVRPDPVCPAGTIHNPAPAPASPECVPAPAPTAPAVPVAPVASPSPPATPAAPDPNAQQPQ